MRSSDDHHHCNVSLFCVVLVVMVGIVVGVDPGHVEGIEAAAAVIERRERGDEEEEEEEEGKQQR